MYDSNFWRDLANEFREVPDDLHAHWIDVPGRGAPDSWHFEGSADSQAMFDPIARRAAYKINSSMEDGLTAWLRFLKVEVKRNDKTSFDSIVETDEYGETIIVKGFIVRVGEASAIFCGKLEARSLEMEQFIDKLRLAAKGLGMPMIPSTASGESVVTTAQSDFLSAHLEQTSVDKRIQDEERGQAEDTLQPFLNVVSSRFLEAVREINAERDKEYQKISTQQFAGGCMGRAAKRFEVLKNVASRKAQLRVEIYRKVAHEFGQGDMLSTLRLNSLRDKIRTAASLEGSAVNDMNTRDCNNLGQHVPAALQSSTQQLSNLEAWICDAADGKIRVIEAEMAAKRVKGSIRATPLEIFGAKVEEAYIQADERTRIRTREERESINQSDLPRLKSFRAALDDQDGLILNLQKSVQGYKVDSAQWGAITELFGMIATLLGVPLSFSLSEEPDVVRSQIRALRARVEDRIHQIEPEIRSPTPEGWMQKPMEASVSAPTSFPGRAKWLEQRLRERAWGPRDVERAYGPDHKTVQKIINGIRVRGDVLDKLVRGLNHHPRARHVSLDEIPSD